MVLPILAILGCNRHSSAGSPRPNILWIVVDTLRADHVGCLGGKASTPVLDRLAQRGALFTNAHSHIPVTGPSHASMFTGLTPLQHGVLKNAQALDPQHVTVALRLRNSGYATEAIVSLGVLKSKFGFAQGFDHYDDTFTTQWFRPATEISDSAISRLRLDRTRPLFLFVHYSDPHEPYTPPGETYPEFVVRLDGNVVGTVKASGLGSEIHLRLTHEDSTLSFQPASEPPQDPLVFRQLVVSDRTVKVHLGEGWHLPAGSAIDRANRTNLPATLALHSTGEVPRDVSIAFFASEIYDLEQAKTMYRKEVEYADREIARLLDAFRDYSGDHPTMIIMTSDHGEGLGDHDLRGHKSQVYESLVHVPLMIAGTGIQSGRSIDTSVSHVDLLPTILDVIHRTTEYQGPGRSLLPFLLDSQAPAPSPPQLLMTHPSSGGTDLRALVFRGHKLIRDLSTNREELYDLLADPSEEHDLLKPNGGLAPEQAEAARELAFSLARRLDLMLSDAATSADSEHQTGVDISREDERQLRALGYLE